MEELSFTNAKHASWLETYNQDSCKLNRFTYCSFIADFITQEHQGFVLNLNGPWGTGKSFFLKMLYAEILTRKHPVIYIDAWESDFSKDPLTVVTSELLNQLNLLNSDIGNDIDELKSFLGKAIKGTMYGAAGIVSNALTGDSAIGIEALKPLLEGEDPASFLDKLKSNYDEQIEAIYHIRQSLSCLAETLATNYSAQLPVIVLIDELDRCRPTYAVELLEVVKHFFQTENLVFLVASDTEQLCHSIKTVYGSGFDSTKYLKRFFDREARLPPPPLDDYLNSLDLNLTEDLYPGVMLAPNVNRISLDQTFHHIFNSYSVSIRDIDQIIAKLVSCLRSVSISSQNSPNRTQVNIMVILPFLTDAKSRS